MNQGQTSRDGAYHQPVLANEVVELMAPVIPGVVVDATFGGGGHSRRLLAEFGDDVKIIAIDRDPEALANARGMGVTAVEGNFSRVRELIEPVLDTEVSGFLFDFGISSRQVDEPSRGFSYRHDGPLDMRMGPDADTTASEVVNEWTQSQLTDVIRRFGQEPMASRIAAYIVRGRPYQTTRQVAAVVAEALPAARRRAGHPARRTFQAIRIAVNDELAAIQSGLDQSIEMSIPGGRVVGISYHSLEDRLVKRRFARGSLGCVCPPDLPVCGCGQTAELRLLTRKAVRPTSEEIAANNRARSAILRASEKATS